MHPNVTGRGVDDRARSAPSLFRKDLARRRGPPLDDVFPKTGRLPKQWPRRLDWRDAFVDPATPAAGVRLIDRRESQSIARAFGRPREFVGAHVRADRAARIEDHLLLRRIHPIATPEPAVVGKRLHRIVCRGIGLLPGIRADPLEHVPRGVEDEQATRLLIALWFFARYAALERDELPGRREIRRSDRGGLRDSASGRAEERQSEEQDNNSLHDFWLLH